jgi:hypothetical protein
MKIEQLVVIGDSHTSQYGFDTINTYNDIERIFLINAPGASIKGLLKEKSTLGLLEKIKNFEFTKKQKTLFVIGQCDVEFGYYYKSVLFGKKLSLDEFLDDLIKKYEKFLLSFNNEFIISAINPCTVINNEYNFNINFKDNVSHITNRFNETGELNGSLNFSDVTHIYNDNNETRNQNHKNFNKKLEIMCSKNNFKFVNLWDDITENDIVKNKFRRNGENHHLDINKELLEILYNKLINL